MAEKAGTTKDKAAAESTTPKAKRTILTPEQRVAKMEADLKAAREGLQAKAQAKIAAAKQQVKQDEERVSKAQAKLATSKSELAALEQAAGVTVTQESDTSDS